MLTSYEVTSAARAKEYFASSVSPEAVSTRRDYYSEGQESPGRFVGKLADALGLIGKPVDRATFDRLCDNLHPTEDRPLTPRTNDYRRVCYDLTFSGPKSFGIVEAFAGEEERRRLRRAFGDAIDETVAADIEPDMQCRERANGADHNIATGNILGIGFDHWTGRPVDDDTPPDMHPHRHLLIWNATRRPDGRIMAGQFGDIVRDKPFYRAAFYARLAAKLEGLGYEIDRRGGTDWEIAGVPQSMIDTFSKRTFQIEDEAEKRGITAEAEKAGLGAKIRSNKQNLTMPELRVAWGGQVTDAEREALAAVYRKEAAAAKEVTAAEAVAYALAHVSEKLSAFPERELKRVALLHGLGSVTPEHVAAELPRHGVIAATIDGRMTATTDGLQKEEDFIVGEAMGGRGSVEPVGVDPGLSRSLGGKSLNDGQWNAVVGLLESSNRVNLLEGPAGAGKSSLLAKLGEGMARAGQSVKWLATTSDAAEELAKAVGQADTVARFLIDEKMQAAARHGRVVVDETSMLGHKDAVKLFEIARKNDVKLIFVGDPMQHGSVARGALMRILKDYGGVQPFTLSEILRQQNPDYRAAAKLLSEGKTLEGFDAIDGMGRIEEIADPADRYRHIAADYLQALDDKKSVLVVSPTHGESRAITSALRSELRDAGKLGANDREFIRLAPVDATVAERSQATTYRPGDVIQFHQNAKGYTKSQRLTVTDPASVPLEHAEKFSLYRPEPIGLAEGDRIRFTGNVKTIDGKHTLKNGNAHTVAGFTSKGIKLENGWVVGADAGHFRHGFVETSMGSQGRTLQRVILGMAAASLGAINAEQLYVSASRAKEWIRLYTDDKDEIRDAVKRSSQKLAALDLPKRPKPKVGSEAGQWAGLRKHMERRKRLGLIYRMRAAWERLWPQKQARRQMQAGHHHERQADHGYGR